MRLEETLPCRGVDKEGPEELETAEVGERFRPMVKDFVVHATTVIESEVDKIGVERR